MSDLLNSASLVMVPSGYKEDTVYSVVPSDGSGDLSFTRASNGTRINSAGLVEVTPWNLLEYSEQFDNGVWSKYQSSVSANTTTAPNGTLTADSLIENTATDIHITFQIITISAGVTTISIYAKANTRNHIVLHSYDNVSQFYFSNVFNLSNGTTTGANQSIENVGNGWYRCSFTFTTTVSGSHYVYVALSNGTNINYAGNGTSGVYIWGYQLNIGSTAKPYFPTTDRLNVPRLTYQNGGGGCPSLLLEKQSTNLFIRSEQFDDASWVKTTGSVTANQAISPDGTQNADLIAGEIYQQRTQANSTTYSFSVFAKKESGTTVYIGYIDNVTGFVGGSINYTYSTGVISVTQSANGSVSGEAIDMGNGWIRVIIKYTTIALVTFNYQYIGSVGSYIWGAQLEASSYPTSYIPTTSSSATRVADACYKTGISSLIGQTEGTMFVDWNFENKPDSNGSIPMVLSGVLGEAYIFVTGGGTLLGEVYNLGLQASISGSIGGIGRKKIALAYKQNDFALYMNGTQIGTDTSGTVSAMSTLYVGSYYVSSYAANSGINEAILFPTRLTNAELASLTTI